VIAPSNYLPGRPALFCRAIEGFSENPSRDRDGLVVEFLAQVPSTEARAIAGAKQRDECVSHGK